MRFRQLRIPPNYLVLMSILNTLPHNARLPQHVVSAVSHRLLWVASITKKHFQRSNSYNSTINANMLVTECEELYFCSVKIHNDK